MSGWLMRTPTWRNIGKLIMKRVDELSRKVKFPASKEGDSR